MGQVYRARDTRLERDVAIKVLPKDFAKDEERLHRFQREAKALASLNHPNIAQIHSVDHIDGTHFLALELVPGESLDERLARGRLPFEEALKVCRDVADGLEAAHEAGVVHRDLKPANIRVTPDGTAKVLDFGLAKNVKAGGVDESDFDHSVKTQSGALLGTPIYMSPEQIRGKAVDRRTDIWAFGCLLFECLTGYRAFTGATFSDVAAAIVGNEADFCSLPQRTPVHVTALIRRCLRKDPKERLRDIGDARVEIEDVRAGRVESVAAAAPATQRNTWPVLILIVGILSFTQYALSDNEPDTKSDDIEQFSITLPPPSMALVLDNPTGSSPPLAISPDGKRILLVARNKAGLKYVYERRTDSTAIRPLEATTKANFAVFSQDGEHIAFVDMDAKHMKRITAGGSTEPIRRNTMGVIWGLSWGPADRIVYADQDRGLVITSSKGGDERSIAEVGDGELNHRWPQILPDGRVLYTAHLARDGGRLQPRILDPESGKHVTFPELSGAFARYLGDAPGSASGFLMYVRTGDLYAIRIDLESTRTIGRSVRMARGIHVSQLGVPHVAIAESAGVLVYEPKRPPSPGRKLVWVSRDGTETELWKGKAFEFPSLAPGGSKVLFAHHNEMGTHEVWTVDYEGDAPLPSKIDTVLPNCVQPIWSPQGDGIVFGDFTGRNMWIQQPLSKAPSCLKRRPGWQWGRHWHTNGRLFFQEYTSAQASNLCELDVANDKVRELVTTDASEEAGILSPNGKWYAYLSNETGRYEVYVRKYDLEKPLGEKVAIAVGTEPVWSHDGTELFFRRELGMYAVKISDTDGRPVGTEQKLFEGPYVPGFGNVPNYDVTEDGKKFVFVEGGWGLTTGRLDIHLNFRAELERALPRAK
jgi:eukaryotic-like serine/threonine-protein kinase